MIQGIRWKFSEELSASFILMGCFINSPFLAFGSNLDNKEARQTIEETQKYVEHMK